MVVWESHHGPVPRGMVIHHKDENKLNDAISNLAMLTKAKHLAEHMADYRPAVVAKLIAARRKHRWSTKSATKRTGRPCSWSEETMSNAVKDYKNGGGSLRIVAARHGVTFAALAKQTARS